MNPGLVHGRRLAQLKVIAPAPGRSECKHAITSRLVGRHRRGSSNTTHSEHEREGWISQGTSLLAVSAHQQLPVNGIDAREGSRQREGISRWGASGLYRFLVHGRNSRSIGLEASKVRENLQAPQLEEPGFKQPPTERQ